MGDLISFFNLNSFLWNFSKLLHPRGQSRVRKRLLLTQLDFETVQFFPRA